MTARGGFLTWALSWSYPRRSGAQLRTAAAVAILLSVAGCSGNTPPLENAFCALYVRLPDPADAIHMKKRENKLAVLTNETTFNAECTGPSGLVNGPR